MRQIEVEILMLESAANSQRECVARCRRRLQEAQRTLEEEQRNLRTIRYQIETLRNIYLGGVEND